MPAMRPQAGQRHAILLWLSLAALLLQSFLVQTHVHLSSISNPTSSNIERVASLGISSEKPVPGGDSGCPLCVEMKIAGHYLLPTPVALIAPPAFAFWFHRMVTVEPTRPQPTHHWQSRAPPRQPDL
jgi:hypothetical protein